MTLTNGKGLQDMSIDLYDYTSMRPCDIESQVVKVLNMQVTVTHLSIFRPSAIALSIEQVKL